MRARSIALLLAISTIAGTPAAAAQADDGSSIALYADWPSDFATAMEEPIPLTPLSPLGDPDLSAGPAAPGSSTAGTLATFTYTLVNPDGSTGPFGDVQLDPSRPVLLDVYLSADETAWPAVAGDPPRDVDYGVAPRVAVDAELSMAGSTVSRDTVVHDLVSAPEPVGTPVQRYLLEFPFEREVLERGSGLEVSFTVRQVSVDGEQVAQPFWNVHTGEAYPTGIQLPHVPQPLDEPADQEGGVTTLSVPNAETREARTVAVGVLIASVMVAAVAGARIASRLRD